MTDPMKALLTAASHALRSYQYGNSSTELAESVADKIDAALSAPEPEGWVRVPLEPTEAMINAASRWFFAYQHMNPHDKKSAIAEAYKAMLAAAPATDKE